MKTAHFKFKIAKLGRRVSRADEANIRRLFKEWERFGLFESGMFSLFVSAGGIMFVARDNTGTIVGTASLSPAVKPTWPWSGEVGFVRVKDELQAKGIGSALMRKVESCAAKLGFDKLRLNSSPQARKFYERLGYKRDKPKDNRYRKVL